MSEWFNAGRISPVPSGTWNDTTEYKRLDIVTDPNMQRSYIAKKDAPAGTLLTDTDYWQMLVDAFHAVSLKTAADRLASPFSETSSAVACHPVEDYPLDVVTHIEPVQEGSGDPYPGGGGKNLFNPDLLTDNSSTHNGDDKKLVITQTAHMGTVTFVLEGEPHTDYTVSFAVTTKEADYNFCWLFLTEEETKTYQSTSTTGKITFTRTSGASGKMQLSLRPTMASGVTGSATVSEIMIERGSTASAYAPYSNIRPITGHVGDVLTRGGKNLLNPDNYDSMEGLALPGNCVGKILYFSVYSESGTSQFNGCVNFADGTRKNFAIISANASNGTWYTYSYTIPQSAISCGVYNVTASTKRTGIKAMISFEDTEYEPYHAETFTTDFGQTVYGGTLNWNTGVLTVDRATATLTGEESWTDSGKAYYGMPLASVVQGANMAHMCSHFTPVGFSAGDTQAAYGTNITYKTVRAYVKNLHATLDDWKAYLTAQNTAGTPVQIVYKLNTPITIQLTPQEILALGGVNTLYAEAGDVTVSGRISPIWMNEQLKSAIIALGGNV